MKLDRLIGIIAILAQNKKVTAPYLAEKFEVSRRTILRDIDALCRAGIPIVTTQGSGGGISVIEGYKLDKSILTEDELQNIIIGLKSLDSISNSPDLKRLVHKLAPDNIGNNIIIDLASYSKSSLSEKIALLRGAISQARLIEFDYYYDKGKTRRKIEPYYIMYKWSAWYLLGYCTRREDFRTFKLNRLWGLSLLDERYSQREVPPMHVDNNNAYADDKIAEIVFDESVKYRLIEDYGPDCFTETPRGLILKTSYSNENFFLGWILSFGDKAEIISPAELRSEVFDIVSKLTDKYSEEPV